jgi:hypothetical protein
MHLLVECTYSQSIWKGLQPWVGVGFQQPPVSNYRRLKTWRLSMVNTQVSGELDRERRLQKVIYIIWNIWNERCRRVFDNRAMQADLL